MSSPASELQKIRSWVRMVWSGSMGVLVSLLIGFLLGIVYKQGDVIDDCKYAGSFRIHSQAFNCQRKI